MGMLLNSHAVKGLPVICGSNGKKIGIITDIQYTFGRKKIDGIIVQDQRHISNSIYIPLSKIITFGQAAVIVEEDFLNKRKEEEKSPIGILGLTVIGIDGHEVGTISDIIFDSAEGSVIGYEISKGFIDDLINGRELLMGNALFRIDGDVLIISAEQNDDIKPNNGGLKNIFYNGYWGD